MTTPPLDFMVFFKIPDDDVDTVIAQYAGLKEAAKKDGKSYILRAFARRLREGTPNGGFTVCAQTQFANLEDVTYYNDTCEAHAELKKVVGPLVVGGFQEGLMVMSAEATPESERRP